MTRNAALALGLAAFGGCAGAGLPIERLARYDASVRSAEALGVSVVPEARRHLRLAEAQSANAQALAAGGDARAVLVLARAQSDAELSIAKAQALSMRVNARRATEALSALQTQGER